MKKSLAVSLFVAFLLYAPIARSQQNQSPEIKAENGVSEERSKAIRGGYEENLDRSINQYGGTRTKEVINESERIRHGGGEGQGHPGDAASQPGLNGREGGAN
jgi:hypothetical protein